MRRRNSLLVALVAAFALAYSACSGDGGSDSGQGTDGDTAGQDGGGSDDSGTGGTGSDAGGGDDGGTGTDGSSDQDTGPTGFTESAWIRVPLLVPDPIRSIHLTEGESNFFAFGVDFPELREFIQIGSVAVDVVGTLETAAFYPDGAKGPKAEGDFTVYYRIVGAGDADAACTSGERFGPLILGTDEANELSGAAEPERLSGTEATVTTINTGLGAICLEFIPHVSGTFEWEQLMLEYTIVEACQVEPEDLSGVWSGTYSCSGTCEGDMEQDAPISLTITQDGDQASYTDGQASYDGTVCGREFRFSGGFGGTPEDNDTYNESGLFVMDADGINGTKNSAWVGPWCQGRCEDHLSRDP